MKIGIQTWGTDGDVRPFIAIADGLSTAGHDVSLVITSVHNKKYGLHGKNSNFEISHVGDIQYDKKTKQALNEKLKKTKFPITQLKIVFDNFFDPVVPDMYNASKKLCEENDIIIGHFLHHPAMLAAEKAGKPYITVTLNHGSIPSKYTVPAGCINLGERINPFWWKFSNFVIDHALLDNINKLRQTEGTRPVKNIMENVWTSKELNLVSVSETLCQKQDDWSENNKICGFLDLPKKIKHWVMPEELKNFIEQDTAPVFLTIGSMLDMDQSPATITEILVQGALIAGCRAIVQSRWGELPDFPDNPNMFKVQTVPHQYIFPYCSAVVHHGGAGTSHSATLHGCPSIVIEHFGDQPLFANELKRIAIAPEMLHRRNVTAKKLAKQIQYVIDHPEMKKKAEFIGKSMKQENGVSKAVQIIESHFSSSKKDKPTT